MPIIGATALTSITASLGTTFRALDTAYASSTCASDVAWLTLQSRAQGSPAHLIAFQQRAYSLVVFVNLHAS